MPAGRRRSGSLRAFGFGDGSAMLAMSGLERWTMRTRDLAATALLALAAAGCVTRPHEENAARRSTWPADRAGPLATAGPLQRDWPSVAGDILGGTSPMELARARAAMSQPLTEALAKP